MAEPQAKVFISYARRDCAAFADELAAGLEVAGFEPFLDRHDITAGEAWEARLEALIAAADTVVFVISPAAVTSERCAWEIELAERLGKRIIPVMAIRVPDGALPNSLARRNYLAFDTTGSFGCASRAGLPARVDIEWLREHARLARTRATVGCSRPTDLTAASR